MNNQATFHITKLNYLPSKQKVNQRLEPGAVYELSTNKISKKFSILIQRLGSYTRKTFQSPSCMLLLSQKIIKECSHYVILKGSSVELSRFREKNADFSFSQLFFPFFFFASSCTLHRIENELFHSQNRFYYISKVSSLILLVLETTLSIQYSKV